MQYNCSGEKAIAVILEQIGEDPTREGLKETPARVLKSLHELCSGYNEDSSSWCKVFEEGACDEMVLLKNIEFTSLCLAGSTFVDTPRGRIPINRLEDGEFVYCWNEDDCCMTIARCVNPRITQKEQRLWRIFSDKDTILCTGDHKFLTHTKGWVKAKNLGPGDSIVALNRGAVVMPGKVTRSHVTWTGLQTQIPEHRFVYEQANRVTIGDKVHVHHINKMPNDNRPENLTALGRSSHIRLHRLKDGPTGFALFTDEQRQAMEEKRMKKWKESQTKEANEKRKASLKRYWDSLSPEEREKRNHKVLLVERTNWYEDVWCMDVPGYENFVANGMVVHNCEHHMLPFIGEAHIAYIPDGKVVGISKLARLLEIYSRRLQIQERIGQQVTDALMTHLKPKGAACVLSAKHLCMSCRGVNKQHSVMITSSLTGVFRDSAATRAEFFQLIKG